MSEVQRAQVTVDVYIAAAPLFGSTFSIFRLSNL